MPVISAREFNRDVSAAKRAAVLEPVFITDRGDPRFVLISIEEYERLSERRSIVDWLQVDDDLDFEPVVIRSLPREVDL